MLLAGNLLQAVGFFAYLVADSFAAVLFWTIVVTLGRTAFWGSYANIVTAISQPGERERWFGFLGALRNVGFAVGGLASGVAISIGTDLAFEVVVAINAASYVFALWLLLAVPDPRPAGTHTSLPGSWATVLADGPYRLLVVAQVGYSLPMMILNFALPVYVVTVLDLPGWVTGVVFTVNCLMVGFGQGLVVNRLTGHVRYRILLVTQAAFAASYVVFLGASVLSVWVATAVIVLGGDRLHARRAHRRPGAGGHRGGGGARAPARPLPVDDPAGLEPQQHHRPGAVRLAAGARTGADLAGDAGARGGVRAADGAARHRAAAWPRSGSPTARQRRCPRADAHPHGWPASG